MVAQAMSHVYGSHGDIGRPQPLCKLPARLLLCMRKHAVCQITVPGHVMPLHLLPLTYINILSTDTAVIALECPESRMRLVAGLQDVRENVKTCSNEMMIIKIM